MNRKTRLPVLACAAAAVAGVACACAFARPVVKNASYVRLLDSFKTAAPVPEIESDGSSAKWDFRALLDGGVVVNIRAQDHFDVVRVTYSDDRKARALYKYKDYSSPIAIRRSGNVLYVYWAETLFRANYWILAYDLQARKELERRRVDAKDIPMK